LTVSDYAVSSYTSNVSSLTDLVRAAKSNGARPTAPSPSPTTGITLISITDAVEGEPSLPGTAIEVSKVTAQATAYSIPTSNLHGADATVESTIEKMQEHSCVHFACHASQDAEDPLWSGFLLSDGRLSLSKIMGLNLGSAAQAQNSKRGEGGEKDIGDDANRGGPAELAFLSACQTSAGSNTLSEEAVHLAAGMIGAGYKGVIATMWSIPDIYAPVIAQEFYRDLFERSKRGHGEGEVGSVKDEEGRGEAGGIIDVRMAAQALNKSVQLLRKQLDSKSPVSFLAWVPYVHFGL